MNLELQTLMVEGWLFKVFVPDNIDEIPLLLVHGWTGDENSMWVFGAQLPPRRVMVAPRAPWVSNHPKYGGYAWIDGRSEDWPQLNDFQAGVAGLLARLDALGMDIPEANFTQMDVAGFSQGAALAGALTLAQPHRVRKLALLAGFLPTDSAAVTQPGQLERLRAYIAHGTQDETVPVTKAEEARQTLQRAGAEVVYCESDVGHKLGANCLRGFKEFFETGSS